MPKVGKMKFPYTRKGMEEAQNYSKQIGKQMEVEGYRYGGKVPRYNIGGLVNRLRSLYKKGGKVK